MSPEPLVRVGSKAMKGKTGFAGRRRKQSVHPQPGGLTQEVFDYLFIENTFVPPSVFLSEDMDAYLGVVPDTISRQIASALDPSHELLRVDLSVHPSICKKATSHV